MHEISTILICLAGFILLLFASEYFSKIFQRYNLPLITGFLFTGLFCGPQVLNLIDSNMIDNLNFLNDISLSFIAFAVGSELYLKEIRTRISKISWNAAGLIGITFLLGLGSIYILSGYSGHSMEFSGGDKLAISLLMTTIFLASSPSSVIAVINEVRAKGPFTKSALAITMIKDVLVIVLFTICFSISLTLVTNASFNPLKIILILLELMLTVLAGWMSGKGLNAILNMRISGFLKTLLIIITGYTIIRGSHMLLSVSHEYFPFEIYLEPLLICVIAGFYLINYTKNRPEFQRIISDALPYIFIMFFTLTGASIDLKLLAAVWFISFVVFMLRIIVLFFGGLGGSMLSGDFPEFRYRNWMPYVTQGAIALGLINEVADQFIVWGKTFETIVTGSIILNLLAGPWLFRKSLLILKEGIRPDNKPEFKGPYCAAIFGIEDQAFALAKQLIKHRWNVRLINMGSERTNSGGGLDIVSIKDYSPESMYGSGITGATAFVMLLKDEDNFRICQWLRKINKKASIIVRIQDRENIKKYANRNIHLIDPSTVIISLIAHFVQSPMATSLIVGERANEDIADIVVRNPNLHGISLRSLKIPVDVIIISVRRGGQMIISHGFTRLRMGDEVTVAGKIKDIRKLRLLFES